MKPTLTKHSTAFLDKNIGKPKTIAVSDHAYFMQANKGYEKGLKDMINGLEEYCKAYVAANNEDGQTLIEDGYISPLLEDITRGLHLLLSGQGKFDGGTISSAISELSDRYGLGIN